MTQLKKFFLQEKWAFLYCFLIVVLASIHKGLLSEGETGVYHLYLSSFTRLFHHQNPYFFDPSFKIITDFKYAPFFGVIMAPFSLLPLSLAYIAWNVFTFMMFYLSIRTLEKAPEKRALFLWLVHIELLTATQNFQVNPLIASLMIFQLAFLERSQTWLASLAGALSFHTKIFGTICVPLFLLFKKKLRYIAAFLIFMVLLFLFPLLFDSLEFTKNVYQGWIAALTGNVQKSLAEHALFGFLGKFNLNFASMNTTHFLFIFISCLPFLWLTFKGTQVNQRRKILSGLLISSVIFNHTSESPTYIIAVSGAVLWFLESSKQRFDKVLITLVGLSTLSPTVWVPELPKTLYGPIKFLPCFLIWCVIYFELYVEGFQHLLKYCTTQSREIYEEAN